MFVTLYSSVIFCTVDFCGAFFSIRSTVCHVGYLIPWFGHARCSYFCVKAAPWAKTAAAAACDKVEISGDFERGMSQQYCEWISDNVDEQKLSDKSPIPAETIRSLQTWWLPKLLPCKTWRVTCLETADCGDNLQFQNQALCTVLQPYPHGPHGIKVRHDIGT